MRRYNYYIGLLIIVASGCLEPYYPPNIAGTANFLVVDGYINTTDHSASVKLSRALRLDSVASPSPLAGASVMIEGEDGSQTPLLEGVVGSYQAADLSINLNQNYRLLIQMGSSKEYVSDFVELTHTPEIDSVTFRQNNNGINILVNTHQPDGTAKYYKWNYTETWAYVSVFFSNYKLVNHEPIPRAIEERIYECWTTRESDNILIGNTLSLAQDIIRDFPLVHIEGGDRRISKRYSILVEQRTLTKEAYTFWNNLRNTTERLGGLSDPQPFKLVGNVHSVNSTEPVLGYFGAGEVKKQRIFIGLSDLPDHIQSLTKGPTCGDDDIQSVDVEDLVTISDYTTLIDPIYVPFVGIVGYTWAVSRCVDCRLEGGVTTIPDFW